MWVPERADRSLRPVHLKWPTCVPTGPSRPARAERDGSPSSLANPWQDEAPGSRRGVGTCSEIHRPGDRGAFVERVGVVLNGYTSTSTPSRLQLQLHDDATAHLYPRPLTSIVRFFHHRTHPIPSHLSALSHIFAPHCTAGNKSRLVGRQCVPGL